MARIFGSFKNGVRAAFDAPGRALVRAGVSPDVITFVGTAGVVAGSVIFAARGHLIVATVIITLCALLDVLDGAMARARGSSSRYGALLDSTMDRVADGAIFGAVAWWQATTDQHLLAVVTLVCLVGGQVVSYVKARAEGLGFTCDVGLAERMERLILLGIGALLSGFGLSWGLPAVLWLLAVLTVITAVQRLVYVRRQSMAADAKQAAEGTAVKPTLKDRAVEIGYAAGWLVIKALPRSMTWAVFRAGADRAARKRGPGAQRLERNLRQVVGPDVSQAELDVLVRDGLRSYARYWLEAFRLPKLNRKQIIDSFHFERGLLLGEAVAAGTGCVVALPHAGNWDLAGAWVGAHGWKLTTVAERLKPESLYQRFVAFRESLGMEIIAASGGSRAPIDVLVDRVREGRVVPLLADRDLSARGVEVRFFGGRTRMPAGPALVALRTGAPLYVCSLWYEGEVAHARLDGPLTPPAEGSLDVRVRALTQQIADQLALGIAEHPADWHMLQKLWLDPAAAPAPASDSASATDDGALSSPQRPG